MKNNDIEEMIDLIVVEKSKTPDFQGALDRLKSINLDYITSLFGCEQSEIISDYGIHDHPNLEMYGDIETLQKLIDANVNQKSNNRTSDEIFKELGLRESKTDFNDTMYDKKLHTYVSFNKTRFYGDNEPEFRNEVEICFYPDEDFDFDKFIVAVKKKMEEKGWIE